MKVKKNLKDDGSVSYRIYMDNGLPHEIINGFLRNRDHRGYAPLTIKSHANDLKEFFLWLDASSLNWSTIDLSDVEKYLGYLSYSANLDGTPRNANSSLRRKISSINSFYRYQTFYTGIHVAPLILKKHYAKHALVTTSKKTKSFSMIEGLRTTTITNHVKTIKSEDYDLLLKWLNNQRDRLFFTLLWETGMRVGQALQLMHTDINYQESSILINYRTNNPNLVYSKNKRPYKVFVPQFWLREYTNYLIEDSDQYNTDYLFCSIYLHNKDKRETPLSYDYYKRCLLRFHNETGIKISCHMFRHTFVTRCIRNNISLDYISRQVGHATSVTTKKIYEHLDVEDLRIVLEGIK